METKKWSGHLLPMFVFIMYLFLYVPLGLLISFSFNKDAFSFHWKGFTLHWYSELFSSVEVWHALQNSLIVALSAVCMSLVLGSMLIFFSIRKVQRVIPLFYANIAVPEIVLAVGLLSFFYFFSIPLGTTTLIAAHTLLGLGYVVPILHASFEELDKTIIEASQDLGASMAQTFFYVVVPTLSPALIAAGLLVFIISFDDFVLSFFCAGATTETLPMYIFSMIRAGTSPEISAMSTLLLLASSMLVLIFSSLQIRKSDMLR